MAIAFVYGTVDIVRYVLVWYWYTVSGHANTPRRRARRHRAHSFRVYVRVWIVYEIVCES